MNSATYVVPPCYEAALYGYSAAKITARKVYLLDRMGKTMRSRGYNRTHNVSSLSFAALVRFVTEG